jgi:RNA polymerase primary sigma factor
MSSNLATIVRRLHPARATNPARTLKLANLAPDAETECRPQSAGTPVGVLARRSRTTREKPAPRLRGWSIKFVAHPSFDDSAMEAEILGPMPESPSNGKTRGASEAGQRWLDDRPGERCLTREQEAHLFRKLNYLKYQAARFWAKIQTEEEFDVNLELIAQLLDEATAVQNRIVRAYLRLLMSIVKTWVQPGDDFFDQLSAGSVAMMRAIECFDFARGRRFSTYATWALTNEFARLIPRERKHRRRFMTGRDLQLQLISDHRADRPDAEDDFQVREEVHQLLGQLDVREQMIVNCRFGLCGDERTLEEIGQELGITKERVRQLESRAMGKLRRFAAARERDPANRG